MQRGKQFPAARQRTFDPQPADPQVRVPAQPVWISPALFLPRDDLRPLRHQVERGNRDDQAEASESRSLAHERAFELKAVGFIVQEVLFNRKPSTILRQSMPTCRFITDDIPVLPGAGVLRQG